jgi:mRNA interferase MazF
MAEEGLEDTLKYWTKNEAIGYMDSDLNPVRGSEQEGIRPVVIVSGNAMNDNLGIGIACPLTSKLKYYAGGIVLAKDQINGLEQDSEVLTFQIRVISKERLIRKLGELTKAQLDTVKTGLMEILTY